MAYVDSEPFTFDIKTADMAAVISDNADLWNLIIPAGREVEVHDFKAFVRLASDTATDSIELCKDDDTVIGQCFIGSTGHVAARSSGASIAASTTLTFPQRVASQSSSASTTIKFKANGATDATTDLTLFLRVSGLK